MSHGIIVPVTQPAPALPPAPERADLPEGDRRTRLVTNVREAIRALPFYFESKTVIEGLDASDLFSLNSVLGGAIEVQTVSTLNRIRNVWDPDNDWADYGFERFSQTFPDVRLVNRRDVAATPVLGMELKGWYLLAKEKAPSYRYTATPDASSEYDLLVVVPWHLADVLSGAPVVRDPYVEQARYAAEMRNYYWQHQRGTAASTGIISPPHVHPYPSPKTHTSDKPEKDSGGNFGRVARVHGLMDNFIAMTLNTPISGIEARHWIDFFKVFTDASDPEQIEANMRRLLAQEDTNGDEVRAEIIVQHIRTIRSALSGEPQPDVE
jgi:hypothetical protein